MLDRLTELFDGVTGVNLFLAVLCLLVGWIASRATGRAVTALLVRLRGLSPAARSVTVRLAKYAVLLLAVGVALTFLGASVQPLLAVAIIVAVVAALALRGISENFAASVILQTRQAVRIGDDITSGEVSGTVIEMNGRAVVLDGDDGRRAYLPNAVVLQHPLVNRSQSRVARSEIEIRLKSVPDSLHGAETAGTAVVEAVLVAAVSALDTVLPEPPVQLLLITRSPRRSTYRLRFWHEPEHDGSVRSLVVHQLSRELRLHGATAVVTSAAPEPPRTPQATL